MCAKGGKQVYVQRLAHINQGSLLQTILTVGNKWGGFFERKKNFFSDICFFGANTITSIAAVEHLEIEANVIRVIISF